MMKLLQSRWTATGIGTVLYLLITVVCWNPPTSADGHNPVAQAKKAGPSWTFQNPEVDQLLAELKREREAAAEKDKQLSALALRLQTERQELNQVTQLVHTLQVEFDRNVIRVREQEGANIKKLAKMYATMEAESAVPILKEMDEATLVKIMASMKDSDAAVILEALGKQSAADAKRAATLTERLRLSLPKPSGPQSGSQ